MGLNDLRQQILQKVLTGVLPKDHCRVTWYGPGTDAICAVCERPVTAQEIEVECDLPAGSTIRLHRTCYDAWSRELRARPS